MGKLYNVVSPKDVNIRSNTLKVRPVSYNKASKTMKFSFVPDGETHKFAVFDNEKLLCSHVLSPRPVSLTATKQGPVVNNLYNARRLKLSSDTPVEWDLVSNGNNQFKLRMNAFGE